MTGLRLGAAEPPWTAARARTLATLVMLVFLVPSPLFTLTGYTSGGGGSGHPMVVVPLALSIGAVHLRHGFPRSGATRPAGWPVTLLLLIALVYLPITWWGWNWASLQWFVVSSFLLLLSGRLAMLAASAPVVGTMTVAAVQWAGSPGGGRVAGIAFIAVYWLAGLSLGGVSLYGSVRLVRVAQQLSETRAELAQAAVGQERLRLSRDLHDLLGQSLAAVSLKGDLALALLRRDPPAARAEIESLTAVARNALHGLRAVTRDEHVLSLTSECASAAELLDAAGIEARVQADPADLEPAAEQLLAWAVREGITNVLRHSSARLCSITVVRRLGLVRLEIENDGARKRRSDGTGLAGLATRARQLSGEVSTHHTGDRFRLVVEVPHADRGEGGS
jgi:two-component system sensor histidine kinase DesK